MLAEIIWPEKFLPGTTDNWVSNEVIVAGLTSNDIWPFVNDITKWSSYYDNCADITPPSSGPNLKKGDHFSFATFGFPPLPCEVAESISPTPLSPGRLAWISESSDEKKPEESIDVYHAWIVEDLSGGRVRILTQESQIGIPAKELAGKKPNVMLNGHQDWLDGLVKVAKEAKNQG